MSKQMSYFLYPLLLFIFFFNSIYLNSKLDFTSESSSIVLKNSDTKLKFSNTNDLTGWNEQSIVQQSTANDLSIANETIYGEGGGSEISAPQNLLYNDSNAIVNINEDVIENSSAIVTNKADIDSNDIDISAIQEDVAENSSAILVNRNDIDINTTNINYNSQAIVTNRSDIDTNTNNINYNSQAIISLESSTTENSNTIVNIAEDVIENSSAIVTNRADIDSNDTDISALQADVSENSSAILVNRNDIDTNTSNINYNSQAIVTIDNDMTLVKLIAQNSAAIIGNSNALVTLDRKVIENSNAIVNNSWAIADLNNQIDENSWAIQNLIEHGETIELVAQNSNSIFNTSQSIITLDRQITENSNAIIQTSNAIVTLNNYIEQNSNFIEDNSWAILNLQNDVNENSMAIATNRSDIDSNDTDIATLQSDVSQNSSAIIVNRNDINTNINNILHNSNAIVSLENLTGDLIIQNSNAIVNNAQHFISLNNGKLYAVGTISGETTIDGRAILSSPIDLNGATLNNGGDILFSSQTTVSSSGYLNPQGNAYILGGDLTIPSAVVLTFTSDGIIDGQGHSLTFGTTAQILIDTAVTLTLRNLTINNEINPISIPPIRCLDQKSKLVLENVKLALNDDFAFKTGQMYVHNDVIFTGSSKFIYQSVLPSYIQPHSTLYFDERTTLDYAPSSTLKDLIVLRDESSSIYLNGATLQTTHTGIQLTKGRLLLENKVTLSSGANNLIYDITYTATPIAYGDRIGCASLDSSNRYLAFSGYNNQHPDLQIHYFDGNVLTGTPIEQREVGYSINSVNWSPDSKYLALSTSFPIGGDELQIYYFNNGSLSSSAIESRNFGTYLYNAEWHTSGKYIAIGGKLPDSGAQLQIYSFQNNILSNTPAFSEAPMEKISTIKWHPNGNFLAVGGQDSSSTGQLRIYSFYDNTLSGTPIESRVYGTTNASVGSVDWSPDGNYIAVSGTTDGIAQVQIYSFYNNQLSASAISEIHNTQWDNYLGIKWSQNGKYLSVAQQNNAIESTNEIKIFNVNNGIISNSQVTGLNYGYQAYNAIWTKDSKYLFIYGRLPYSGYELQQYEIKYMFDATEQTVSNAIILGDANKGSDYNLELSVLGGAQGMINGYAWYDSTNSSEKGKLDFANIGASLVLSDTNAQLKISNIENIVGWKEGSIVSTSGNNNTWLSSGINYGHLGPQNTPPPARLLYHNSNAIVNLNEDLTENSMAIATNRSDIDSNDTDIAALQSDVTENSNVIVNLNEDLTENSMAIATNRSDIDSNDTDIAALQSDVTENSNVIVNLNEDLTENSMAIATNRSDIDSNDTDIAALQDNITENSSAIVDFTSTDYTPLVTAITGKTSIPHRSLMESPIDLSGSTLTIHGDLLFSTETQITTSGSLSPLQHAFLLGGPLNIPDEVELKITTSGIIDGQGNTLHLGREAQLILDGGISVTLKNITIKNIHNSLARPPIKLIDWQTHLSLDEATIALNDDFAFPVGQLFINNDVIFTGTSKFIYQSVSPSYITQHSSLFFDKETTFEYSPSSSNKNLINLVDNTSGIYFNGCTLQSTHTGIRLTTGRMFLDNKVTMSSIGEIQQLYDASYTFSHNIISANKNSCKWSSDGRYFAIGESDGTLKVYSTDELKNNSPNTTAIFNRDLGNQINSIDWSPDNKYIAIGTSTDELKVYELSNLKGNPASPTAYFNRDLGTAAINHLEFSPSGKYISLARSNGFLTIYSLESLDGNPSSPTAIFSQDVSSGSTSITQVRWSPNGQYIMISENGGLLRIYEFTTLQGGGPYTPVHSSNRGATCVTWNPDGEYIAIGFGPGLNGSMEIYALSNLLGSGAYTPLFNNNITQGGITSIKWSPNGNYISVGNSGSQGSTYLISMEFQPLLQNPNPPTFIFQKALGSLNTVYSINYSPQGKYLATTIDNGQVVILENNFTANIKNQAFDSSIIFGDSVKGSNYNLNSFVLGGARVEINGIAWFDDAS